MIQLLSHSHVSPLVTLPNLSHQELKEIIGLMGEGGVDATLTPAEASSASGTWPHQFALVTHPSLRILDHRRLFSDVSS